MAMKLKVKDKSKKQEAQTAKELGGKTTIASGALVQKGDVFNDHFLVECKTTEKPFYSLTETVWKKIKKEALNSNMRLPVMRIDIDDTGDKQSYAVLRELDFTSFCYGRAVYCLETMDSMKNVKSFRVERKRVHLVNSTMITGKAHVMDGNLVVVIEWDDFLVLANSYFSEVKE